MNRFLTFTACVGGFGLLCCMLFFLTFSSPNGAKAQIGSAVDHGIWLTIDGVSRFDHGQRLRVDYTITAPSNRQGSNRSPGNLMESPHIWLGNTLVRGNTVSYKKISPNKYRGTVVAQLHQYRTHGARVTFYTYSLLNQRGSWKIDFYLE
ncbi:hypothetical protein ACFO4N_12460 [Camelliibacillus cellulosilyticus]|uniref:DUF4878 domain-containing protein n=1 Tax=Camelliibacillus cellulosilyticus TaxID=2174486 RepID=A0ABV9GS49_9BACL